MLIKMLIVLSLIGWFSIFAYSQGPACTQYQVWGLGGFAGFGPEPDYSSANPTIAAYQSQYGGVGPICTTSWYTLSSPPNWIFACHATAWTCKPQSPPVGGPTCPNCGAPVSLADGNVSIQETDVRIPGLGGGLTLTRTWNSTWPCFYLCLPSQGMFGSGWASTYEESIGIDAPDGFAIYHRADGSTWAFASYGSPAVFRLIAPTNGPLVTLSAQGTNSLVWTVTFENGEQRVFNGMYGGPLSAIIDRNGNTTSLTYTPTQVGSVTVNRLTTITDPAGRHLNFTYNSDSYVGQVSAVTSDPGSGINVTYTYVPCFQVGRFTQVFGDPPVLTQVTQADNTFISFSYGPNLMITSVNDTNGKVLEAHTFGLFGCNAGLSSSQANGVDALTLIFPNMSSYCSPGGVGYPMGAQ
jgi:hypothetical protein